MISQIQTNHVGPLERLEANFSSRLNLVTGDNGLGKTFLLDACWFALTRQWAKGEQFYPKRNQPAEDLVSLKALFPLDVTKSKTGQEMAAYAYLRRTMKWVRSKETEISVSEDSRIVIYCRVDGGFSVCDPARNDTPTSVQSSASTNDPRSAQSLEFSKKTLWYGLRQEDPRNDLFTFSEGLIHDIEKWRLKGNGAFSRLQAILKILSPPGEEQISIGESVRVGTGVTEVPVLKMPYGDVPLTLAASGIKRIVSLAYLLVWTWEEHLILAEGAGMKPASNIILLVDEVDSHLHPRWQRVILPALLEAIKAMSGGQSPLRTQAILTTHSGLIPASLQGYWNDEEDTLFDFDLENGKVTFNQLPFGDYGASDRWLMSESFDLPITYGPLAESAMREANLFMRTHPDPSEAPHEEAKQIHENLMKVLGGVDPFWTRWLPFYEYEKSKETND